jgi:arsenate reductase
MVCDRRGRGVPGGAGAEFRLAVPFVDPEGQRQHAQAEAATYDERCAQIAREFLYVMTVAAR